MMSRVREGACLLDLVRIAMPICKRAERACPRSGPGRKPEIPDWALAVLIMVAILKQRKSKSAQYRFLAAHRAELLCWLGIERFPARSTYFDRYRRIAPLLEQAIRIAGAKAIRQGFAEPRCLAVDQSAVKARGRPCNQRQRARGRVPRGADTEASWTYNRYHGWIFGYSYEVVVTACKSGAVWPLLASVDPAHWHAARTFPAKIAALPEKARYVLADAGYDSNAHAEAIEYDRADRRTGRRFLCPQVYRRGEHRRPKRPRRERGWRAERRKRRDRRREFFQRPWAQKLYRRRSQTVEPFNDWMKTRFDLHDRAWHRGLANNRAQLLTAVFAYQILLHYNHQLGRQNGRIQWILDSL